jgi:hypothetical protein
MTVIQIPANTIPTLPYVDPSRIRYIWGMYPEAASLSYIVMDSGGYPLHVDLTPYVVEMWNIYTSECIVRNYHVVHDIYY